MCVWVGFFVCRGNRKGRLMSPDTLTALCVLRSLREMVLSYKSQSCTAEFMLGRGSKRIGHNQKRERGRRGKQRMGHTDLI